MRFKQSIVQLLDSILGYVVPLKFIATTSLQPTISMQAATLLHVQEVLAV